MRARGTGSIFQPRWRDPKTGEIRVSPALWIRYSCRSTCGQPTCGGVHREASGFAKTEGKDETARAERLLRRRLSEVDGGRLIAPVAEKTTFADLAEMLTTDYRVNARKSLESTEDRLVHLREFFGGATRAIAITTDRITQYIADRQGAGAAPATIRNELAALRRAFTLAAQAGKVPARPHIPSIEVRNTRAGFFEQEAFDDVLRRLPDNLQPVMEFAYLTGWRKSEMLSLRWSQVDFRAGEVRLEPGTTKNDEGRTFPFSVLPPLGDLLRRQRERTTDVEKATGRIIPWVFHHGGGKPWKDYYGSWRAACEAAGVPGQFVHDFRRTAVRRLERAGVPRSVAMKLTGHKTEAVYRRYAIVAPADLRAGVAKLAEALAAEREQPAVPMPRVIALRPRSGR